MDTFLQELEVSSGGMVAIGWRSLCSGFRLSPRTRDGLPQAPAVAVVRLAHDSATALSKEASNENLWKLNPTPSRRKLRHARPSRTRHHCNRRPRGGRLRVFVRTGSHTSFVRRST